MVTITKGTKEYLPVLIADALESVADLATSTPTYDVYKNDPAETAIETGLVAAVFGGSGMLLLCLIDTTGAAYTDLEGEFNLFVQFTAAPEVPRLGPLRFRIDD
jgi:hypothetical protein